MAHDKAARPAKYLSPGTALVLIGLAFCAGLLAGTLLTAHNQPTGMAQTFAQPQGDAGAHPEDEAAHIEEARAETVRNPSEPLAWIHLGNLYFDAHKPAEAVEAYEKALALQPGNDDVTVDLGTMYRSLGDTAKALALYDSVIARNPAHMNAAFNKGVTLMLDRGDPPAAMSAWRALLAAKPDAALGDGTPLKAALPSLATDAAMRLDKAGKTEAALAAYDEALRETPDFQPALGEKAALLARLGRQAEADALWKRLKELNPQAVVPAPAS